MKVLGLCGAAGSGKDHVYKLLDGLDRGQVMRVALADEVRHEVEEIVGGGSYLPTVWEKPYPVEIRSLLQWWGTDLRRKADEDYWVNKTAQTIEGIEWEGETDLVVVTDIRFANEAEMVRDLGGWVAEVGASAVVRARRLGGQLPPAHASEVIDFQRSGFIWNDLERPMMDPDTAVFLGYDGRCFKCLTFQAHPFHDGGSVNE